MLVSKLRIASVTLLFSSSKGLGLFRYTIFFRQLKGNNHKEKDPEGRIAWIFVHPFQYIYLETFYSNIESLNQHNGEEYHPAETTCFTDSFSAVEKQNIVTFSCSCAESRFCYQNSKA